MTVLMFSYGDGASKATYARKSGAMAEKGSGSAVAACPPWCLRRGLQTIQKIAVMPLLFPPQLAASFNSNRCWWLGQLFGTGLFCSPVTGGVLLSSHLIGASQNDEIIEPIVHRLLSYFMLICEILSWSASALNGLLMKRITPAYLASIILY